jgi:hypothetical protein
MARLFSNIEYIDIVLVYGEGCGSASRARRVSVRLLHVGVHDIRSQENGWKMMSQQFGLTEVC